MSSQRPSIVPNGEINVHSPSAHVPGSSRLGADASTPDAATATRTSPTTNPVRRRSSITFQVPHERADRLPIAPRL